MSSNIRVNELKEIYRRNPLLINLASLCVLLTFPFFITIVMWKQHWPEIKATASTAYNGLIFNPLNTRRKK